MPYTDRTLTLSRLIYYMPMSAIIFGLLVDVNRNLIVQLPHVQGFVTVLHRIDQCAYARACLAQEQHDILQFLLV